MTEDRADRRRILVVSHTARFEAIEATISVVERLRAAGVIAVMDADDRDEYAPHLPPAMTDGRPAADIEAPLALDAGERDQLPRDIRGA